MLWASSVRLPQQRKGRCWLSASCLVAHIPLFLLVFRADSGSLSAEPARAGGHSYTKRKSSPAAANHLPQLVDWGRHRLPGGVEGPAVPRYVVHCRPRIAQTACCAMYSTRTLITAYSACMTCGQQLVTWGTFMSTNTLFCLQCLSETSF